MSKECVEKIIERASKEPDVYRSLSEAQGAEELLSQYELTADERNAVLSRDREALNKLGVSRELVQLAEWCTGE